eukprot:Hpha_TRINITY_DN16634_c2_g1::TRINITY_DN16634_c2_g1_i1::g.179313::m.179313/K04909/KCNH6; potassium voltage-gated channel Eag-related subfamily H member 6
MHEISDAEFSNYVRMFKTYDSDGSGTIDQYELSEVMRCLGVTLTTEQLNDLMRSVDVDASGEIEFNEFLLLMVQHKESQAFRILQKSKETLEHVRLAMSSRMILPDLRWRWAYDLTMFFTVVYYLSAVTYAVASQAPCGDGSLECYPTHTLLPIEVMASILFIADVVLNFRTAYIDTNGVLLVEDPGRIAKHYVATTFFPDVIAALPLDLVLGYASDHSEMYLAFYSLRVLKVFRLPFLFGTTHRGSMDGGYVTFYFQFIPMMKQIVQMLFTVHFLTCIWLRVQGSRSTYVQGLYLVLYTITTVGYGDIYPNTDAERMYACFLFLAGLVVNAFVMGKMAATLQKGDIKSERKARMTETLAVLQHFEIPLVLQNEILAFQHHVLEHDLSSSYSEVVASLPSSMQDSLGLYIRVKFVMLVSFFVSAREEVQVALAQSLKNIVVAPEEFIIVKGEEGKEMFFVGHGFADVIGEGGAWISTVKKGHIIGEIALLVQCDRTASLKALTYCDLFRLDKADFWSIVKRFPGFQEQIRDEIKRRENAAVHCQISGQRVLDNLVDVDNGPDTGCSELSDIPSEEGLYKLSSEGLHDLATQDEAMRALDAGVQELVSVGGSAPLSCWQDGASLHRVLHLPDGTVSVTVRKGEYSPGSPALDEGETKTQTNGSGGNPKHDPYSIAQSRMLKIRGRELKVKTPGEDSPRSPRGMEGKKNSSFLGGRPTLRPIASTGVINYSPLKPKTAESAQWRGVRSISIHSDEAGKNSSSPVIETSPLGKVPSQLSTPKVRGAGSDEEPSFVKEKSPRKQKKVRVRHRSHNRPRGEFISWAEQRIRRTDKNVKALLKGMASASQTLERMEQAHAEAPATRRTSRAHDNRRVSMAASVVSRLSDCSAVSFSQMRRGSASVLNPVRSNAAIPRGSIVHRGSLARGSMAGMSRSIVRGAGKVPVMRPGRVAPRHHQRMIDDPTLPGGIADPMSPVHRDRDAGGSILALESRDSSLRDLRDHTGTGSGRTGRTGRFGGLDGSPRHGAFNNSSLSLAEQQYMSASGLLQQELSDPSLIVND